MYKYGDHSQSKNSVFLTIKIRNFLVVNSSASGGFAPQTPTGAPPLDPAGGLPSPRPPLICSPGTNSYLRHCQKYIQYSQKSINRLSQFIATFYIVSYGRAYGRLTSFFSVSVVSEISVIFRQLSILFTALHGMQTRSSDEISVRPSVCPSVCQTRAL